MVIHSATIFLVSVCTILGLAIGSFLNVVIYRVPRNLSVVRPASACPNCDTPIRSRDNVPLLSWLVLRGKCRTCSAPISARYPAVEVITAAAFLVVAIRFVPDLLTAPTTGTLLSALCVLMAFLYLAAISVALAAIDVELHRLPNAIVLPAYAVGVVLLLAAAVLGGDVVRFVWALVGAAAMFTFYFALALVYPGGMGFGDVKLAGVLGLFLAYLGLPELVVGLGAAFLLGGLAGLALLAFKRASRKTAIPFGPWMLAGAWVGIFAGDYIADGYLRLVGLN
jgi:leader peptidase (prepilin peptidase)/N-methyltransferase